MQHAYTHELNLLYILKTGNENISSGVMEDNASEAAKTLFAHVSLIVFGVVLLMGSAFAIWSASRRR
jgi:hypothetical protein